MNDKILHENYIKKEADLNDFKAKVKSSVSSFEDNFIFKMISSGKLSLNIYHKLLINIFHQTYFGPVTFALAASRCSRHESVLREYLIQHAEEEKLHWTWVISDLKNSNYSGVDPRSLFPTVECQAYVAYANYLANLDPLCRLAMAMTLEGISAKFGKKYGTKACEVLNISIDKSIFFVQHGMLDEGHSEDVEKIILSHNVSGLRWAELCYAVEVTASLYKNMYNAVIR
ncbi:hypothetical protein K2X05_13345 [bacterium]|nr:hypothetical protein [bacterium]